MKCNNKIHLKIKKSISNYQKFQLKNFCFKAHFTSCHIINGIVNLTYQNSCLIITITSICNYQKNFMTHLTSYSSIFKLQTLIMKLNDKNFYKIEKRAIRLYPEWKGRFLM